MNLPNPSANNICGVILLNYNDLQDLIYNSSSSRKYFLSLPVLMQIKLHEHNNYIHTSAGLHAHVEAIEKYNHAVEISEALSFGLNRQGIRE